MIATSKNVKKAIIIIYEQFITEFLFNPEYYDQYANDERAAFKIYMENSVVCGGKGKTEFKDKVIDIHGRYLDYCEQHNVCEGCPYKELYKYKGACLEPFLMEKVKICTPVDIILHIAKISIIAAFSGVVISMLLG